MLSCLRPMLEVAKLKRYAGNNKIINASDYTVIRSSHIVIVGLGGLGGCLAESLARIGVKKLTLIDPDIFQVQNLNRQRFATTNTIGLNKVDVTKTELKHINPNVTVHALHTSIERCHHDLILLDADLLIDAVDVIETKRYIEHLGQRYALPVLHGAIGGWYGQFALITNNYDLLNNYYEHADSGVESVLKCPTFLPPIIANMMIVEWLKYITKDIHFTSDTLVFYDTKTQSLDPIFTKKSSDF